MSGGPLTKLAISTALVSLEAQANEGGPLVQ